MIDLVSIATILGTVVLGAILAVEAATFILDRRDKRLDREDRERNRPHFSLVDVVLHEQNIQLVEYLPPEDRDRTLNQKVRKARIGVVKVIVKNQGFMNAKNARALFELGEGVKGDTTEYAVWGSIVRTDKVDTIMLPYWVDIDEVDNKFLAELLRTEYFGDKPEYPTATKIEVAPTFNVAACLFYTIQEDDKTHMPLVVSNARQLPLEIKVKLQVVMDDVPPSYIPIGKIALKRWNELVYERA